MRTARGTRNIWLVFLAIAAVVQTTMMWRAAVSGRRRRRLSRVDRLAEANFISEGAPDHDAR